MGFSFLDIIIGGMTIWGDIIILLTLASAILILLGGLIARLTNGRPPRWTWQWEAFAIGMITSTIGYAIKLFSDELPIGAILQLSRITAGLILLACVACVVMALALARPRPQVEQSD
jgi:hypothetical protein